MHRQDNPQSFPALKDGVSLQSLMMAKIADLDSQSISQEDLLLAIFDGQFVANTEGLIELINDFNTDALTDLEPQQQGFLAAAVLNVHFLTAEARKPEHKQFKERGYL